MDSARTINTKPVAQLASHEHWKILIEKIRSIRGSSLTQHED